MQLTDLKVYVLNVIALTLTFSHIETLLKIILLLVSIGYTATKWYEIKKNLKQKQKDGEV